MVKITWKLLIISLDETVTTFLTIILNMMHVAYEFLNYYIATRMILQLSLTLGFLYINHYQVKKLIIISLQDVLACCWYPHFPYHS